MMRLIDSAALAPDHVFHVCAPFAADPAALLAALDAAFPLHDIRTDIAMTGRFGDADWRAASGHLLGRFDAPLAGIPATGRLAWLRFGRFDRIVGDRIAETLLLLDLPSLMIQAGCWPFAAPLGPDLMAPPPLATDGTAADALALVEAMIAGLMRYDGQTLASMRMVDFWRDDFCWYGPAAIGSFRGHADYERGHQRPFLAAFPDRRGGNHRARIAEGGLVASTGWPSIRATHSGGDWLGLAATGRPITMRVMDFWACRGGRLSENWVMIDIPDLLTQLGVDIFERMRALNGGR